MQGPYMYVGCDMDMKAYVFVCIIYHPSDGSLWEKFGHLIIAPSCVVDTHIYYKVDQLAKQPRTHDIDVCKGCISLSSQYWRGSPYKNHGITSWKLVNYHNPLHGRICVILVCQEVQFASRERHPLIYCRNYKTSKIYFCKMVCCGLHLDELLCCHAIWNVYHPTQTSYASWKPSPQGTMKPSHLMSPIKIIAIIKHNFISTSVVVKLVAIFTCQTRGIVGL